MGPRSASHSPWSGQWSDGVPDEVLVAAAIDGDEEAFGVLASRHRGTAIRTATQIVGRNGAEDVVQDALLLAFRALRSIQDPSRFSRWLAAITRFRALRVSRTEARRHAGTVSLDENVLATVSSLAFAERKEEEGDDLLLQALERIPPRYAEVIRLHFLHGLPHGRIAGFIDAPLATVKWRCFRAKQLLRSVLEGGSPGMARMEAACHRSIGGTVEGCPAPARGRTTSSGIDFRRSSCDETDTGCRPVSPGGDDQPG